MPRAARLFLLTLSTSSAAAFLTAGTASAQVRQPPSAGDRVLGLDISAWQGNISQTTWGNLRNRENRRFVFIRSSRGGTTGYYDQSDPDNSNNRNTRSQRYDDPYFVQNIDRATTAGMLAGPYHFGRMDIVATTKNANGIANNGTDEANHFLEMAGSWMRPGYLLPVFDLEAGIAERTPNQLARFALDFSNRIYAVKGVRPIVYIGGNYASDIATATPPLPTDVVNAFPNLWSARWPNQADPDSIPVQTGNPGDSVSTVYGQWDNVQGAHPWKVWQYASTGRLQSFNNGNSNLDFDVAHGNIEYMKDMQVPALWTSTGNGTWSALMNWNSGQPPVPPVYGPGQVPAVGTQTLPTARLPGPEDNVDLERVNENVTVTLSTAANVRRIDINERLNVVTGGALGARLSGQVGNGGALRLMDGGTATFGQGFVNGTGTLEFVGNGTLAVDQLFLANNGGTFTGTSGTGQIVAKGGAINPALDLMNGTRSFNVNDGSAPVDMRIGLPLTNGSFTKTGPGTLELAGSNSAFAGNVLVNGGTLRITGSHGGGGNYAAAGAGRIEIGSTGNVIAGTFNGAGPVTVNGALTTNGGGTVGRLLGTGTTTVGDGVGLRIAPGVAAAADTSASRVASEAGELTMAGTGYVDLTNNDLVIRGNDLADGVADSTAAFAAVISGRGATGPNATKLHDGPGLRSTTSATYNATQFVDVLGLTAVLNGDLNLAFNSSTTTKTTFGGLDVGVNDTLVRFGMIADLNFDGSITAQDYFAIDQAFLGRVLTRSDNSVVSGPLAGDLTGDGQVNASDYFLIDQAFLRQGGVPIDAMVEFQRAAFGDEFVAMAFTPQAGAVPEPATLSLLALGATAMTGRRRRWM